MSWWKRNGGKLLTVAVVTVLAVLALRLLLGLLAVVALVVLIALGASAVMKQRWAYNPSSPVRVRSGRHQIEEDQQE